MPNRFEIKSINIISEYGLDINTNNTICYYCRNSLNEPSITYKGKEHFISKVVQGECEHYFHEECINKWLKTSNICPICTKEWIFKKKN